MSAPLEMKCGYLDVAVGGGTDGEPNVVIKAEGAPAVILVGHEARWLFRDAGPLVLIALRDAEGK